MIPKLLLLLARCLLETALVCLAVALLFVIVAFRIMRRLVKDQPDPFERVSQAATILNNLFPPHSRNGGAPVADEPPQAYDPGAHD